MGLIGNALGTVGGSMLGQGVGQYFGGSAGGAVGSKAGGQIGSILGSLLPFENGGMVKKTGPALVHKGELVVPKHLVKHVPKGVKSAIKRGGGRNM